jgi:hypothetical protein
MAKPNPFQIDLSNVTHVVIEIFGGDNRHAFHDSYIRHTA